MCVRARAGRGVVSLTPMTNFLPAFVSSPALKTYSDHIEHKAISIAWHKVPQELFKVSDERIYDAV